MFTCGLCSSLIDGHKNLMTHRFMVHKIEPTTFPCPISECNSEFGQAIEFYHHIVKIHPEPPSNPVLYHDRNLNCVSCKQCIPPGGNLSSHLQEHLSANEPVVCPGLKCHLVFTRFAELVDHGARHHKDNSKYYLKPEYSASNAYGNSRVLNAQITTVLPGDTFVNPQAVNEKVVYISIIKTIKALFTHKDIIADIATPQTSNDPNLLTSFWDGHFHSKNPTEPEGEILINLFAHEVIYTGSSVKRFDGFYFSLLNILPHHRSALHTVHPCLMVEQQTMNSLTLTKVIEPLVEELKILAEGIYIPELLRGGSLSSPDTTIPKHPHP